MDLVVKRVVFQTLSWAIWMVDKVQASNYTAEGRGEGGGGDQAEWFFTPAQRHDCIFNERLQSHAPPCAFCAFLGATKQRLAIWLVFRWHRPLLCSVESLSLTDVHLECPTPTPSHTHTHTLMTSSVLHLRCVSGVVLGGCQ